jgi:hypothetical protein
MNPNSQCNLVIGQEIAQRSGTIRDPKLPHDSRWNHQFARLHSYFRCLIFRLIWISNFDLRQSMMEFARRNSLSPNPFSIHPSTNPFQKHSPNPTISVDEGHAAGSDPQYI